MEPAPHKVIPAVRYAAREHSYSASRREKRRSAPQTNCFHQGAPDCSYLPADDALDVRFGATARVVRATFFGAAAFLDGAFLDGAFFAAFFFMLRFLRGAV